MNEEEKQAMLKAFEKCFPDVFSPNDVAQIVFEHGWKAAREYRGLSDTEIDEYAFAFDLWLLNNPNKTLEGIKDFTRAILKKASEK